MVAGRFEVCFGLVGILFTGRTVVDNASTEIIFLNGGAMLG